MFSMGRPIDWLFFNLLTSILAWVHIQISYYITMKYFFCPTNHVWLMKFEGFARVGLTKYHLKYLGDIVYLKFSDIVGEAKRGGNISFIRRPDLQC